jgi:PDZ domain-containing protein
MTSDDPTPPFPGPNGVPASESTRRTPSPWYLVVLPLLAMAVVLEVVRLPYFVISPGPAREVGPLIQIRDHQVYPPEGHLLLTAVFETRTQVNAYEAIKSWLDPTEAVIPERYVLAPGETPEQGAQIAISQMDTSKIDATVVALTKEAGYPKNHGPGALVESVVSGTPAEGKLFAGDLILSIDGEAVETVEDLGRTIRAAGVGHSLTFKVRPIDMKQTRTVTIAPAKLPGVDYPAIGIGSVDNFPFSVEISSGDIGGPSAGLMWTLGLIDLLTPGDLTEGKIVAGTGTIGLDGSVGPIGGIQQKVAAAERARAVVFFAPADQAAEASEVARHIEVVSVKTYMDALRWLGQQDR